MRILNLAFLPLLFLSCSNKSKIANYQSKAISFYNNGDFLNAAKAIESARLVDSLNFELRFLDGKIKAKNNFNEASNSLMRFLIQKNYKADTCFYILASNFFSDAIDNYNKNESTASAELQYKYAARYLDSAISRNNMYYFAYVLKYRLLHNLGEYAAAISLTNRTLGLFGDSIELVLNRGVEKMQLGDLSGAINDIDTAIESKKLDNDPLSEAYRLRGLILFDKNEFSEALKYFTTATELDNKNYYSFYYRALCYKKLNQKDLACNDFRKSVDLGFTAAYNDIKDYCEFK